MKKKVKLKDNIYNKELIKEIEIPAKDHLQAQIKYKSIIFEDKRKKKPKYKNFDKEY